MNKTDETLLQAARHREGKKTAAFDDDDLIALILDETIPRKDRHEAMVALLRRALVEATLPIAKLKVKLRSAKTKGDEERAINAFLKGIGVRRKA